MPIPPKVRALADELRRLRREAGVTQIRLAELSGVSKSSLSRVERGEQSPRLDEVEGILAGLNVPFEVSWRVMKLAREAGQPNWLAVDNVAAMPRHLGRLVELEDDASDIFTFAPFVLPGLVQIESYARMIFERGGVDPARIDELVAIRLKRQRILRRARPVRLDVIIDEAALERLIRGHAHIAAPQLQYLLDIAALPYVTLRLIPFANGAHACMSGHFTLIRFADGTQVVFAETGVASMFVDEPEDLEAVPDLIARLRQSAISPADTTGLIRDAITRLEST